MNIEKYAERTLQDTLATAEAEDALSLEAFTQGVAQRLAETGEFAGAESCFHSARDVEVSGYALEDGVFNIFVTDYRGTGRPEDLTDNQIRQSFQRLSTFIERSLDGYADVLEESSPAFELADLIRSNWSNSETARLHLFSDASAREPKITYSEIHGIKVSHHVWDLERMFRFDTLGLEHESIDVEVVQRFGAPLPCLKGPSATDHDVYLLVIPGEFLARLYNEFGPRLLERNVRSFLQSRVKTNSGIRDTLLKQPDRFLAYNNGISATARSVSLVYCGNDAPAVARIDDLQIVNGGQTTASLAAALHNDNADLSDVAVQMKLTVVGPETMDELVPYISQYANTQNKVTGADFSSNDPFHIAVEALSRSIWAPDPEGTQRKTRWFYERTRGQFADEISRNRTPTQQKEFKTKNPPSQKFTKTDLAKFENTWEQRPHVVSLGAEKNYEAFRLRIADNRREPDVSYFECLVAKAILFRTGQKLISAQKFGGYGANIVTYTVAKLSHATGQRLDLASIWKRQRLSDATAEAVEEISRLVFAVITDPPERVRNISEWCKRLDCWKRVEEINWHPSRVLQAELIGTGVGRAKQTMEYGSGALATEESEIIADAAAVEADTWFRLSSWAKETSNLQPWQRGLAYSLGKLARSGRRPSVKQARQGITLHEEAKRLGFR